MRLSGVPAITILFVSGTISGFAAPIERTVDSAECKGIIARLLEAPNASLRPAIRLRAISCFLEVPKSC
jgi:hypothetical protein